MFGAFLDRGLHSGCRWWGSPEQRPRFLALRSSRSSAIFFGGQHWRQNTAACAEAPCFSRQQVASWRASANGTDPARGSPDARPRWRPGPRKKAVKAVGRRKPHASERRSTQATRARRATPTRLPARFGQRRARASSVPAMSCRIPVCHSYIGGRVFHPTMIPSSIPTCLNRSPSAPAVVGPVSVSSCRHNRQGRMPGRVSAVVLRVARTQCGRRRHGLSHRSRTGELPT